MERFAGYYDAELGGLLDHMPPDTLLALDDPAALDERAEELWDAVRRGFDETRAHYPLISPPEEYTEDPLPDWPADPIWVSHGFPSFNPKSHSLAQG